LAVLNIEKKTEEVLGKIIEDLGYVLYDIEYVKEGKEYHLCVYIDKEEGIDINDCEKVTDAINPILDKEDFINEQYFLEVSSCGLERKLRKKWQFAKQIGNKIEVKLFAKLDDKKEFVGILKEYDDAFLVLSLDQKDLKIETDKIASAKTVYDWGI